MEVDWHRQLDEISNELQTLETRTEDGPVLVGTLLRLIDVLHSLGENVPSTDEID